MTVVIIQDANITYSDVALQSFRVGQDEKYETVGIWPFHLMKYLKINVYNQSTNNCLIPTSKLE